MPHRLSAAMLLSCTLPALALQYPDSPRVDVVDDYHGTEVADPWRWLEDTDSDQTRAWVQAQNAVSLPLLAGLPQRDALERRLTELWNYERYGLPEHRRSGLVLFQKNDGLQNQSVLYAQQGLDGEARVLLDPNALAADGTVALTHAQASDNDRWLAYGLSSAGSDWNAFRVLDVETGQDTADVLSRIKFSGLAWTHDNQGFFYSRFPAPPAGAAPGTFDELANQKLYYHRLGTPQSEDVVVYERPDQPRWGLVGSVTDDGRYLLIYIWESTSNNQLHVKDLGDPHKPQFDAPAVALVDRFEADFTVVGNDGPVLYVFTNDQAPRGRIVAIDVRKPQRTHWRAVVPEGRDVIQSAHHIGGQLVLRVMRDASSRLLRYGTDGQRLGEIALPGIGTVASVSGRHDDPEMFFSYTAYNQPTSNYRVDLRQGRAELFQAPEVAFDPDDYVTEQAFFTSRDHTRVPMFITYRKGLKRDGRNPVHLYGYGGFNIPLTPSFSVANLVWMEQGGVYAVANLRGGGEYGRDWHHAGILDSKQNVFDDFIAAAGHLIHNGWTAPRRLAISGRSNGGLLVGAALNQAPHLFAAAVPGVGVMDMLRFHRFTIGWAWTSDYGSSDDPDMFPHLHAYSPYHNVRPGTEYPAVLVTTADHDDRVVPGHSFKYTAALQAAQAGDQPVLIRIDVQAGHGAGKPVSKVIEESADVLAFMWHYSGGDD